MRTVAERLFLCVLAAAEERLAGGFRLIGDRRNIGALVRAVAERLALRVAAPAERDVGLVVEARNLAPFVIHEREVARHLVDVAQILEHDQRLNDAAELIVQGGRELAALMAAGDDIQRRAYAIETIEKKADRVTQTTIELLHKTFVPPLDRDDIHQLITNMDDILDLMQDVAESVVLYDVRKVTAEAKQLGEIRRT